MRPIVLVTALTGMMAATCLVPVAVAGDACSALTPAQVSQALGTEAAAGAPIVSPTSCQWMGKGKWATLTITQPLQGRSPIDRFNAGKSSMLPGITVEPTSGVGDDAYYVYFSGTTRAGLGLVVKKGSSAFEIRVYGLDIDQAKGAAKTLAQSAVGHI